MRIVLMTVLLAMPFLGDTKLSRGNGVYFCPGCGQWAVHPHVCSGAK